MYHHIKGLVLKSRIFADAGQLITVHSYERREDLRHCAGGEKYPAQEAYSLCRCGHSGKNPFCDGTHCEINFQDGDKFADR